MTQDETAQQLYSGTCCSKKYHQWRKQEGGQLFSAWQIPPHLKKIKGLKKIKVYLEDDEQTVIGKITSETQDAAGFSIGFPQLKTCGGFELMRCATNCRDLSIISCAWNAKDLCSSLGGWAW